MTTERQAGRPATGGDLIYLLGCTVNEITPDLERIEKMDLEAIHELSELHSLESASCIALETAWDGRLPDEPLFHTWTEEKNLAIYKNALFDAERREVLAFLEKSGIWYLPLKGILLKELYPRPEMRQMSENDILIDSAGRKKVHDWFLSRGYKAESYQQSNHDAYRKKPVYNFEMHVSLFEYRHNRLWQNYYADIRERMLPDEGGMQGGHLSNEDFYIYIITHACKHHSDDGTGLRTLLDCYVYNKAKGDILNRPYIHNELTKLGVAEFEEAVRDLSQRVFGRPEQFDSSGLTEEEATLLGSFLFFGTYGTVHNHVRNRLKAMDEIPTVRTKLRYLWGRLFPEMEIFKNYYPFFYRHRWLLPAGCIYRLVYKGIIHRKKMLAELRALRKL
ncbi:MAG: nucleotidyltransferase family protein [Lachnospiraceae bacterium]|nr:nucleotidyltransferase family protein [Lachnospiraceae bacterium]